MITYSVVSADHPICRGELPEEVEKDLTLGSISNGAVLAFAGVRLVGFFRFDHAPTARALHAAGTWVHRDHRKDGVAVALWAFALRRTRAREVWVKTVTKGGRALVAALLKKYTRIRWVVV